VHDCSSTESEFSEPLDRTLGQTLYSRVLSLRGFASLNCLGKSFEFGRNAEKDLALATKCYATSAEAGNSRAIVNLGFCFQHGLGVDQNLAESVKLFEQSTTQRAPAGVAHYALCVHFGSVFYEDLESAADYYGLASDLKSSVITRNSFRCFRGLNAASPWKRRNAAAEPEKPPLPVKPHQRSELSRLMETYRTDKYTPIEGPRLGIGGFGTVTLRPDPITHERIAVKHLSLGTDRVHLIREVESLVRLRHPRIIRILQWADGTVSKGGEIHMELAPNGNLRTLLESAGSGKSGPLTSATGKARIICDIAMGMRYVHAHGIMHRDLKPSNILMDENWRAKIADFGLSRHESADGQTSGDTGTIGYAAPEQLDEDVGCTTKTDVFAFGLITYEIITGEKVFGESEPSRNIVRRLRARQFPPVPDSFGTLMQSLIRRCWAADPRTRPSFDEMVKEFQAAGFQVLPGVDGEYLRRSVTDLLEWEGEHGDWKV
jgi:hypothetical protein